MRYSGGQLLAQYKYLGKEPEYNGKDISGLELAQILNWYSSMMDSNDAKNFIVEYIKNNDLKIKIEDKRIIPTYGWIARIINRGGKLENEHKLKLEDYLISLSSQKEKSKKDESSLPEKVFNDPLDEIMPKIENFIDSFEKVDIDEIDFISMKSRERKMILDRILSWKNEYEEVLKGNCPHLNEGYSHYKKSEIKKFIKNIDAILFKLSIKAPSVKKEKKINQTREKIKIAAKQKKLEDRKFKLFRFLDRDDDLQIKSVDPKKIVGSQTVFLLDRRKKVIYKLVAEKSKSLDINRTNIINIDRDLSVVKRIGRNLEEYLSKFKILNKTSRLKFVDDLKQKPCHVSGQTSHDHLILGVY